MENTQDVQALSLNDIAHSSYHSPGIDSSRKNWYGLSNEPVARLTIYHNTCLNERRISRQNIHELRYVPFFLPDSFYFFVEAVKEIEELMQVRRELNHDIDELLLLTRMAMHPAVR